MVLECFGERLEASCGVLGMPLGPLGGSGVLLGSSWELLGTPWKLFGSSGTLLGSSWVLLGSSLGAPGSSLGRSWALFGVSSGRREGGTKLQKSPENTKTGISKKHQKVARRSVGDRENKKKQGDAKK